MLLTDANVDHLGGLATLRQGGTHGFYVRSSSVVRSIATAQPAFAPFDRAPHHWLDVPLNRRCEPAGDGDPIGEELTVLAHAVPGLTPGYDGRRNLPGAVVAYEIVQRDGARLLFAPVFSSIDDALAQAIARADVAFLDRTFCSDDELLAAQLLPKRAWDLGHQPVGGLDGTLARVKRSQTRLIFTHMNNSNPMLDPGSEAHADVRASGAEIAYDGMELRL